MERQQMFKFVFVLLIGLLAIFVFSYSYFGGDGKDEELEDMFDFEENNEDLDFDIDDFDVEGLDEIGENDSEEEFDDWVDDNTKNKEKFGNEKIKEAKNISKQAIIMWLEENDNEEEWEGISTTSFLYYMSENIVDVHEPRKRTVSSVSVNIPSDDRDEYLTTESIVEVFYENDKSKTAEFVVVITFDMQGEDPLINELMVM